MKARVSEVIAIGDALFTQKLPILSLWQTTCEQFYPERSDYTTSRSMGMEFASNLMTGHPVMASRDLANAISAMLRPPGQPWFHARTPTDRINKDVSARIWLDWASEQMRLAMYENTSGWTKAAKEGDRDFVTIGNACISLRPNRDWTGILYGCTHMRDVAWAQDDAGQVNHIHVKRKISALNMTKLFPKTVSAKVKEVVEKDPHQEFNCRHVVMPMDDYDARTPKNEIGPGGDVRTNRRKLPFISLWIDTDNQTILEEIGQWQLGYVAPRWSTVSGFPYGYSPPTVVTIADARMLQQITLTLLEAGQKSVDPPMKAVGEAIEGGVNFWAGGVTWVSADYDEKTGRAIEPLMGTNPNLGWGVDREDRIARIINDGHFLNQIKLPDTTHARTAYEVQKLWEEFIRNTTPLFEPITSEYNGAVCDRSFELMLRMNAFGNMADMPKVLRGQQVRFTFESPLTLAANRANAMAFTSAGQLTQLAVSMDPDVIHDFDVDTAYRDAMEGTGAPATWLVPKEEADKTKAIAKQQRIQQAQLQQGAAAVGTAADTASKIGNAATLLSQGGVLPQPQVQNGGAM